MAQHRNLLVILTHGYRADACRATGVWPIQTPHFDQMLERGVGLAAVGASPATDPARVSLFTGLHPRQHGVLRDGDVPAIDDGWVKQLIDGGYFLSGVGRIGPVADQLHDACRVAPLDQTDPDGCAFLQSMQYRGVLKRVQQQRRQLAKTGPFQMNAAGLNQPAEDVDGFITQQAQRLARRLPKDRPWALIVAFTGPGNDLPAPPFYIRNVGEEGLGDGYTPADLRRLDHYADLPYPRSLIQQLGPATLKNIRRHYLARAVMLDHAFGLIRDSIERCGHAERTWSILGSDHGKLLGERGLVGHRATLSPAVHVPIWLLPPDGVIDRSSPTEPASPEEPAVSQQLLSTVDLAATLCAIGGVDPPPGCAGRSILPALRGEEVGADAALSEHDNRLMLETMQHSVTFDVETEQPRALFDLLKDPQQRTDLTDTAEGMAVLDMLRWQLAGRLMQLRCAR